MESGYPVPSAQEAAPLLDVRQVAAMLGCSARTVQRLARRGKLPRPLRVAALARWRRRDIADWIARARPGRDSRARSAAHESPSDIVGASP
jgi:excisionase family DNA binding protein